MTSKHNHDLALDSTHEHSTSTFTPAQPLTHDQPCAESSIEGLAIGRVVGFQDALPLLGFQFGGVAFTQRAMAVACDLSSCEVGDLVCVFFDQKQRERPVVLGKLTCDVSKQMVAGSGTEIADDKQITLRCGKASISLKSDGTVAIRGTNVASRASHTNRIRGGNVQIN